MKTHQPKHRVSRTSEAAIRVALQAIESDVGLRVRSRLDPRTVRDYVAKWKGGVIFPPILLYPKGQNFVLLDGHHRFAAAAEAGLKEILATVFSGTVPEAVLASIEHNARHGLRLSNADKRASVRLALTHAPERSDAAIAAFCGVTPRMVATHRGSGGANGADLVRVGRDGKCYPRKPRLSAQVLSPEQGGGRECSVGITGSGADEHRISDFAEGIIKLRHIAHSLIARFPEFHGVVHHEFMALARRTTPNDCSMPPRTTDINDIKP